ncbi:hypothetical protein ACLKA6_017312 [Drosophila palustris]
MFLQSQHYRSRFMASLTPQCERLAHACIYAVILQKEPRDSWPVNQHLVTDDAYFRGSSAVEESHRSSIATTRRTSSEPVASFLSCGPESRRRRTQFKNSHQKADANLRSYRPGLRTSGVCGGRCEVCKAPTLRTVGSLLLTAEELQTTLVAVEAVLNSRPIGALSDDPSDGEALTPGHALIGGPLTAMLSRRGPGPAGPDLLKSMASCLVAQATVLAAMVQGVHSGTPSQEQVAPSHARRHCWRAGGRRRGQSAASEVADRQSHGGTPGK